MSNTYDYDSYLRSADYYSEEDAAMVRDRYVEKSDNYDPFIGTPTQTHRLKAYCKVLVNGYDVTNKLDPYLVSVRIRDGSPSIGDLELDDRDGNLPIPPKYSSLEVWLGWKSEALVKVFTGTIMDLEHSFGRKSGGRRMFVEARWDLTGNLKAPMQNVLGDGQGLGGKGELKSLGDWIRKMHKDAGIPGAINIHSKYENIKRYFWQQNGSFNQTMESIAKEFGGEYRVRADGTVDFTLAGEQADGSNSQVIQAVWGDNLIGWRVRPWLSRGAWGGARAQWFDHAKSNWMQTLGSINNPSVWGGATAKYLMPAPAPNKLVAQQQVDGVAEGTPYQGKGRIIINGEPRAQWQHYVNLVGARPGVDGTYIIDCAEHIYSRQGYITYLEVRPRAKAGAPTNINSKVSAKSIVDAYEKQSNVLEPTNEESQQIHSGITY